MRQEFLHWNHFPISPVEMMFVSQISAVYSCVYANPHAVQKYIQAQQAVEISLQFFCNLHTLRTILHSVSAQDISYEVPAQQGVNCNFQDWIGQVHGNFQ